MLTVSFFDIRDWAFAVAFNFQQLEQLLVCPASRSPLLMDGNSLVCTSAACRLRFEVRDDIPIMLVEEAQTVPVGEWETILRKHGRDPAAGHDTTQGSR